MLRKELILVNLKFKNLREEEEHHEEERYGKEGTLIILKTLKFEVEERKLRIFSWDLCDERWVLS
jgi:hypothetical protein